MINRILKKISIKRIVIFAVLLILIIATLLTDNILIRSFIFGILVIYIAFNIFLRESSTRSEDEKRLAESEKKENETDDEFNEDIILNSADISKLSTTQNVHKFLPDNLKEKYEEIARESLPADLTHDSQFNYILEKILEVIKSNLFAHSAIYFWYNRNKDQLIVQNFRSDEEQIHKAKFDLSDDIISKVIRNGSPEISNNINSNVESDVIKYYDNPVGIKSAIGVPIFYNEMMIGVLAADSKSEDAFGFETAYLLGKYVRMISLLLNVFEEKYDDFVIKNRLDGLTVLLENSEKYDREKELMNSFISVIDKLIDYDACAIVLSELYEKNFKMYKVVNKTSLKYLSEGILIDYYNSFVGTAIQNNRPIRLDDISIENRPIYTITDPFNFGGSVMIIPLRYNDQNFGAIVFENLRKNFYSVHDTIFLMKVSKFLSHSLNSILLINFFNSHNSIDLESSLLNKIAFEKRFTDEFLRAKESNVNIGLALISIDKFEKIKTEYGNQITTEIIKYISQLLQKESDKLNLIGRLENNKFAVIFYNVLDQTNYVWCEKIKQKVLKESYKTIDGNKSIPISLSIGYSGGKGLSSENILLENSDKALKKAAQLGNNVSFYKG